MDTNLPIKMTVAQSGGSDITNFHPSIKQPLGDDFQQLLVTLLLATSLSSIGTKSSQDGDIFSPMLMAMFDRLDMNSSANSRLNPFSVTPMISNKPHITPVNGILTQRFHKGHPGVDTGVPIGTPIKSTMDGNVLFAGWNNEGYGNLVIIQNGEYKTYYAHLSEIPVNVGERVFTGTTIGFSGSSGNSTGPHLHYEVRINDKPVDPANFNGMPGLETNTSI
jgi:murein DD-endopeptidase MepM/ murein hydrolase activator NlpD